MSNWVDEIWAEVLEDQLNIESDLYWGFDYINPVDKWGISPPKYLSYNSKRKHAIFTTSRYSWSIKSKLGEFFLLFSLDKKDGAIESRNTTTGMTAIRPILILEDSNGKQLFWSIVGKKTHLEVNVKESRTKRIAYLDYPFPHLKNFTRKILEVIESHEVLSSVYSVNNVPTLGSELLEVLGEEVILEPMLEALDGGLSFFDLPSKKGIEVELMGTPKKASIQRVAHSYLKKISSSSFDVRILTTHLDNHRVTNKRDVIDYKIKDLSELDKAIPKYIFGVDKPDMIKWVNFYIEIRTNQVRISAPLQSVTNMQFEGKNKGIEITIKSNDFTPTEILTMLQYGTEFVSTFKRYSQF